MLEVVGVLDRAPSVGLGGREPDGVGHLVGVENGQAVHVARGAPDGLDERGLRAEKAFLVGVQDSHAGAFRKVETLAQQVDADDHVVQAGAEVAKDGDPLEGLDIRVKVIDLDVELHEVARQIFGHPLGQRGNHDPLVPGDALLDHSDQIVDLSLDRPDVDHRIEQTGRTDDLLDVEPSRFQQLVGAWRGRDIDDLVELSLELFK